jgi:predicted ester cyclase
MKLSGKAGLRVAVEYFFTAFNVRSFQIEQVIAQDSTLIIRSRWQVLHQGEYLGVEATGKVFDTWNVMWLVVRDGKVISDTSIWDAGELRRLEELAAAG